MIAAANQYYFSAQHLQAVHYYKKALEKDAHLHCDEHGRLG
jgi:hypothetical protein